MTEESSASSPHALDAPDMLGAIEELAGALRQLGAARRMTAAEHARLSSATDADRRAVLDGWRASLDVLEQVIGTVEGAIGRGQDGLYSAARSLTGLPPKARPR